MKTKSTTTTIPKRLSYQAHKSTAINFASTPKLTFGESVNATWALRTALEKPILRPRFLAFPDGPVGAIDPTAAIAAAQAHNARLLAEMAETMVKSEHHHCGLSYILVKARRMHVIRGRIDGADAPKVREFWDANPRWDQVADEAMPRPGEYVVTWIPAERLYHDATSDGNHAFVARVIDAFDRLCDVAHHATARRLRQSVAKCVRLHSLIPNFGE